MKKYTIIIVSLLIGFSYSCDKIEEPFKEIVDVTPVDTSNTTTRVYVKRVMVEDFTGHKCTYCPAAHRELDDLIAVYGSKIVPLTIHAGDFTGLDAEFITDFTTTEGTAIYTDFQVGSTPKGLVDRTIYDGNLSLFFSAWGAAIQQQLADTLIKVGVFIENSYNDANRELTSEISVEFFDNYSDTLSLAVYYLQDSIIAPQIDGAQYPNDHVHDYEHKHVLRGSLSGTYGEEIISGIITKNQIIEKTYKLTLDSEFNEDKCTIVAFVLDTETKEILNVEELEFKH